MTEAILFHFTKPDRNRPIEEQFVTEIKDERKSFVIQEDAMIYLFDNGVRKFHRLTKEVHEYVNADKFLFYEFWQVQNRVGYVSYDYQPYINENDEVKRKRMYIWRFIGFGRSCFADTEEELEEAILQTIKTINNAPEELGYNSYPYYTKYYRDASPLKQMDLTLDLF